MDHCTFLSEKAELQDWNTDVKKRKEKNVFVMPILSVFTSHRLTKVQSQEAASDLETMLMQNPKRVSFFMPAVGQL